MSNEELYPCVGICMPDPDSGRCMGCGRPPLESPEVVVLPAAVRPENLPRPGSPADPDTPQ
ncbi:MAG: DUF1289 domain-containing protein [Betaproteobacteria bacterium]|nr:DUF1289 domain-containing protein [Betaproteobacteria bacterium]HMV19675.1 DUF1289 domain-containing protein [Rhodocyclaceae bacterium]HMW76914.1 DUF1289 domain-containing protein [Rhodocyclaceae bacterium]HNE42420.1 DUF1289 domain-containing protein [Rhodocyclaceae bacterium]HNL22462.1 DUF1289 domain-containing protein [Rhodocyclaceae bacterium]